jgi:hypothetical protein
MPTLESENEYTMARECPRDDMDKKLRNNMAFFSINICATMIHAPQIDIRPCSKPTLLDHLHLMLKNTRPKCLSAHDMVGSVYQIIGNRGARKGVTPYTWHSEWAMFVSVLGMRLQLKPLPSTLKSTNRYLGLVSTQKGEISTNE